MFDEVVFWKDTYDGEYAEGGIFTRAVDLRMVMVAKLLDFVLMVII
jgi:hypothetical protein